jgi:outer membrane protein assembly factor BamB
VWGVELAVLPSASAPERRSSCSPVVGGGRGWAHDYTAGALHALDPATGQTLGQVFVGQANRFAAPAIYGSLVLVPTLTGVVFVRTS